MRLRVQSNPLKFLAAVSFVLMRGVVLRLRVRRQTVHFKAQPALSELREELFSLATSLWNEGASARI